MRHMLAGICARTPPYEYICVCTFLFHLHFLCFEKVATVSRAIQSRFERKKREKDRKLMIELDRLQNCFYHFSQVEK